MRASPMRIKLASLGLVAVVTTVIACGCGDDEQTIIKATPTAVPTATPAPLVVALSGDQQVPPVASEGSGTANIIIDDAVAEIRVDISIEGIAADNILFAHFHLAPSGEAGGIVASIAASSPGSTTFTTVITPEDVIPLADVEDFDDLVTAIRAGRTYINIHTLSNPIGELRGQTG